MKQEMKGGNGITWTICKSFASRSTQLCQHVIIQFFYRSDAVLDAQPTASKHWRQLCLS